MNNEKAVWELRLGFFGTHEQAKDIRERIARVLCPDPDHAPPCPIPWSVSLVDESAIDPAPLGKSSPQVTPDGVASEIITW
jgi:hypothetical protein